VYLSTGAPPYSALVPNRLFRNDSGKRFADVTYSSGTGHLQKGHQVAFGDWDRDGDLDLFVQLGGATPGDRYRNALFQNPGQGNHWINVRLIGTVTNRSAIGAELRVTLPGPPPRVLHRPITAGSSFGGNPFERHIGIGTATSVPRLDVWWPTSRSTQVFTDPPVDSWLEITEGRPGWRRLAHSRLHP
jgi:hypothetical protein